MYLGDDSEQYDLEPEEPLSMRRWNWREEPEWTSSRSLVEESIDGLGMVWNETKYPRPWMDQEGSLGAINIVETIEETKLEERSYKRFLAPALVGSSLLVLLILVLAIMSRNNNDMSEVDNSLQTKSSAMGVQLPQYTLDAIESDPKSPQSRAYNRMRNDPELETYSDEQRLERFAVTTLFYALNGRDWEEDIYPTPNYQLSTEDRASSTNEASGGAWEPIRRLALPKNNMFGALPPELGMLTALESLDLSSNRLYGSLPPEIFGSLTKLTSLVLQNNRLTSTIPTEIGLMSSLEHLWLNENQFIGFIPTELGILKLNGKLDVVSVHGNPLFGVVPQPLCDIQYIHFDCEVNIEKRFLCGCSCVCMGELGESLAESEDAQAFRGGGQP